MEAYYRQFGFSVSMAELEKCNATTHIELNQYYANGDNEDGTKRFQAMYLIISTDSDRYSGIWNDLNNITLLGTDNYTKTTTAPYNVLCRYKKPAPPCQLHAPPSVVTFFQSGDIENNNTTLGNAGRYFPEVTCYRFQERGRYAVD